MQHMVSGTVSNLRHKWDVDAGSAGISKWNKAYKSFVGSLVGVEHCGDLDILGAFGGGPFCYSVQRHLDSMELIPVEGGATCFCQW